MKIKGGKIPNNMSTIIRYKVDCMKFLWMGGIETTFLKKVKDNIYVEFEKRHDNVERLF